MELKKENVEKVKQYLVGSMLPSREVQQLLLLLTEENGGKKDSKDSK